jgi:phosphatidylglycerophosphate synthase
MTNTAVADHPHGSGGQSMKPGYRANLSALRAAQKPSRGVAAYGRYVNRPAGRVVAAVVHQVGMTPNVATAISATLSGLGIVLLATVSPSAWTAVAVPVLLAAGYIMDSVDGQLARLRGRGSVRGEWLDHTVDCFKTSSLHLAVAISWFRFLPDDLARHTWLLLVPLGYSVVQAVTYFGFIVMPYLRLTRAAATTPAPEQGPENPWRKWLILPTDYGFLIWVFALIAWPIGFVTAYTALFVLSTAMLVLALRKWWGELGAIDRASA